MNHIEGQRSSCDEHVLAALAGGPIIRTAFADRFNLDEHVAGTVLARLVEKGSVTCDGERVALHEPEPQGQPRRARDRRHLRLLQRQNAEQIDADPMVQDLRDDLLTGELLDLDGVVPWIEKRQAAPDENPTWLLWYGAPGDNYQRASRVGPSLRTLAQYSEQLATRRGWNEGEATICILTGEVPWPGVRIIEGSYYDTVRIPRGEDPEVVATILRQQLPRRRRGKYSDRERLDVLGEHVAKHGASEASRLLFHKLHPAYRDYYRDRNSFGNAARRVKAA